MSFVSNETLVLLGHESAAHKREVVRCGLEVVDPPSRLHAMTLRFKVHQSSYAR